MRTSDSVLQIRTLRLELPASLGARRQTILRLLRAELLRLPWPQGTLAELEVPTMTLASRQTNLAIARALARGFYQAACKQLHIRGVL
jgi:hypothetical protein